MVSDSSTPETRKKIIHSRQKISELKANQLIQRLELVLLRIYPQRMVYSEHYVGPVAAACGRDETGLVGVVLWGEQIQRVRVGDIVTFESGWCRERKGELVVSTGRNGKLTVLGR